MKNYKIVMDRIGRTKREKPAPIFVEVLDGTPQQILDQLADKLYRPFGRQLSSRNFEVTTFFDEDSTTKGQVQIENGRFGAGTFEEVQA